MKVEFICPACQGVFKETPSSADFNTKCPHCGIEVLIAADPSKAGKASKDAERQARIEALQAKIEAEQKAKAETERVEAARKEAEEKAKVEAERVALRKQEEENAKTVAWEGRSVKRICPHCKCENTWKVTVKPGVKSFVVRCPQYGCNKKLTIVVDPSDNLTPLTDIINELQRIKFLIGFLFFWLVLLPLICWAVIANFHR
jgi:predicted  nucleic acid-binding Zn-ribbon protein